MDESILVSALIRRERNAFVTLVSLYQNRILNTCYRFLLDKNDAEDLCQDVFIEIFQSIHNFRGDAKLSTWMHRIAISKCLDELKRRKRKKRISSFGRLLHLDDISYWISGSIATDREIEKHETMTEVQTALSTLPNNQRIAFTLSKIDGYSNPEISEIMSTTTLAVESLIYRAKKAIGEELNKILSNS